MSEKLGLIDSDVKTSDPEAYFTEDVKILIEELYKLMAICGSDFTNTFRDLALLSKNVEMTEED